MTEAQIRTAIQTLVRDTYGLAGTWLGANATILDDFIDDALEEVVLDLMIFMRGKFAGEETIDLEADEPDYTLTNEWWQIYKMERNVSDERPREIDIVKPQDKARYMYVGQTQEHPDACIILDKTITFLPIPSTDKTEYVNCIFIRPEAVTLAAGGPTYMPRPAHRMICYSAAAKIAMSKGADASPFMDFYNKRLKQVKKIFAGQDQQKPKFVGPSMEEKVFVDTRENRDYGFFE